MCVCRVSRTEGETTERDMSVKKNKIKISMFSFNNKKTNSKNIIFLLENFSLDKKSKTTTISNETTFSQLTLGLLIIFHI